MTLGIILITITLIVFVAYLFIDQARDMKREKDARHKMINEYIERIDQEEREWMQSHHFFD